MGRSISCAVLASLSAVGAAVPAHADRAPTVPFERVAGRIASHIAGRAVTVHCDGEARWPAGESGFVSTQWNGATGQLLKLSTVAELSPAICRSLRQFATAQEQAARSTAAARPRAYASYAIAILTLAHESVHLSGIVGGTLPSGLAVGDPQAEAKADCYGMQWMPYVAQQLGASSGDAQAVARYFWNRLYGLSRTSHPAYWSPACRPGGALDIRAPGTAWP